MKIRNGDTVTVTTGKDKGKTGQVLRVLPSTGRIVVAGINMRTKHVKKTPNSAGQRLQYEASIHASNVMLVDPKTKKGTRVGYKLDAKGKKVRIAKKSGEMLTGGTVKAAAGKKSNDAGDKESRKKDIQVDSAKEPKSQKAKVPFWKKMGFGEVALEDEAELAGESHMKEDHSVPEKSKSQDTRSHARGK